MRNPKNKDIILSNCDFYYNEDNLFLNNKPLYLEIGMGKGNFIIEMAKLNPNINFIGLEKFSAVASIAIKKIAKEKLDNLKVIVMDIGDALDLLEGKIDLIYLNFSDPWPKKRHFKRRLTHENYLRLYDKLFKDLKEIVMKTDNNDLFEFSLASFKKYGYEIKKISYDLHQENIFNIMTEYEEKFSELGFKIRYVQVIKK